MASPLLIPSLDAGLVWAAIQAIAACIAAYETCLGVLAATVAAIVVVPEFLRIRREETAHQFRGFEIATSLLSSDAFLAAARALQDDPGVSVHPDWFNFYPPLLHEVLRTAELLDFLIREGHLDEPFLLRLYGYRLGKLAKQVSAVEQSYQSPHLFYWGTLFPKGRALLKRAEEWLSKNASEWQFLSESGNPAAKW